MSGASPKPQGQAQTHIFPLNSPANDQGHAHTILNNLMFSQKTLLYQNPTLQKCKEELL